MGEDGTPHDTLLLRGPRRLAADLAADARMHLRPPGAVLHRLAHLLGEVLHTAFGRVLMVCGHLTMWAPVAREISTKGD